MKPLISDLTIGHKLGKGHFGEVFEGVDPVHGPVAVKVLVRLPEETEEKWQSRRDGLVGEAQNLKKATHRNVVKVHHLVRSEDGGSVQFVMDFCSGGSLQAAFTAGPLRLSRLRRIATDVALGLQALHAREMIHRDIKPANVLLDGQGRALLADFGLVTDDIVLGYAAAAGYSDHLAKEVYDTGQTSTKTDIWALGMTIYRMLHGQLWYSESPQPRKLIKQGGFALGLKWLPHVPDRWRRVIRSMMHDDTARRCQTAEHVLDALASLTVVPDWKCNVSTSRVRWTRRKGNRKIVVTWNRHSDRRHDWIAMSKPVDQAGKRHTIASSDGVVSRTAAVRELEDFFSLQVGSR